MPEVYLTLWENAIAMGTESEIKHLKAAARRACRSLHKYAALFPVGKPRSWLYRGRFEWLAGRQRRAHKHWRKSLAYAQHLAMPYEAALTHFEIGRHLSVDNHAARATRQTHLKQAIEIFERLGTAYDLERAKVAAKTIQ